MPAKFRLNLNLGFVWGTRYVDSREYASAQNSCIAPGRGWYTSEGPPSACGPPFDQPFRLLLNVAVGGLLPNRAPSKATVFPQTMLVIPSDPLRIVMFPVF